MSQQHKSGIMTLTVDHNEIIFQCAGAFPTKIARPANVGVIEWMNFWGGEEGHTTDGRRSFTHEGALKAHKEYFQK